ncbi:hypothetical protein DCC85_02330 [Paenibacillus sp. CAA11]|nr:hypothetical protein DCC85_02330 [Paenibacillus sp. CAA11]
MRETLAFAFFIYSVVDVFIVEGFAAGQNGLRVVYRLDLGRGKALALVTGECCQRKEYKLWKMA